MSNKAPHFDITPHIVKQLGEQLVSDEITALQVKYRVFDEVCLAFVCNPA